MTKLVTKKCPECGIASVDPYLHKMDCSRTVSCNTPVSQPDGHAGETEEWTKHWIPSNLSCTSLGLREITVGELKTEYDSWLPRTVSDTPVMDSQDNMLPVSRQVRDLEVMNEVHKRRITRLEQLVATRNEQLDYERTKADAYRTLWSARQYLTEMYVQWGTCSDSDTQAWALLGKLLYDLEAERFDGEAIRSRYKAHVASL